MPGRFGIGELGYEARRFLGFLARAGQTLWQVLPLGETGFGNSPYQSFSAFARNPLLIDFDRLVELGYLSERDLAGAPEFPADEVVYDQVMAFKFPLLRQAAENFREWARPGEQREFEKFCSGNAGWLDDYALFMALKEEHGGCAWTSWKPELVRRQPAALEEARQRLQDAISARKYWQFEFSRQWQELRAYCRDLDIQILGDIPIYVAHDSSDVWAHPELFHLDAGGNPTVVAGVPPDYFSETGQLWGNPIYRWEVMARTGYGWWIERFRANRALVDILRLDHFRGFQSFWEVPATEKTAVRGRWVMGPREALFREARQALGELPLVAENLGVITPDVEELRQRLGLPGMAVLQFAFGAEGESNNHRPHNFVRDLVAYSGTHDNDTTVGWWTGSGAGRSNTDGLGRERELAMQYLSLGGNEIHWAFIRTLLASVAERVVFPLQDVLGLGSEARMNMPGRAEKNWTWRYRPELLTGEIEQRLRELTELYERG